MSCKLFALIMRKILSAGSWFNDLCYRAGFLRLHNWPCGGWNWAAGLLQGALGIITYIAPLENRQLYIGAVVSVFGISACGGPILGGVLSDRVGWRWCFWM